MYRIQLVLNIDHLHIRYHISPGVRQASVDCLPRLEILRYLIDKDAQAESEAHHFGAGGGQIDQGLRQGDRSSG